MPGFRAFLIITSFVGLLKRGTYFNNFFFLISKINIINNAKRNQVHMEYTRKASRKKKKTKQGNQPILIITSSSSWLEKIKGKCVSINESDEFVESKLIFVFLSRCRLEADANRRV
jgi:hypothetical protein